MIAINDKTIQPHQLLINDKIQCQNMNSHIRFNFHSSYSIQQTQNHPQHTPQLIMLKPQKRHSQTLSLKKPKPIQITLTKKDYHNHNTHNYGEENLNQSVQKAYKEGLSLVRPLKEKPLNIVQSHTLDLKSLKSKELKLKQEVCPSYKINWGSTPLNNNNSSRLSQTYVLASPQQTAAQQLNHLIKTNEYKKYTRQIHDLNHLNPTQFYMNAELQDKLQVIKEQQPIMSRQVKQGSSMNSVKSKIKGITKGFLRDGKNVSKPLENEQKKTSQVVKYMPLTELNQSLLTQPSIIDPLQELSISQNQQLVIPQQQQNQLFAQQTFEVPQQPSTPPSTQQPLTQRTVLKQHYAELQVRLEQCVQQIVEIQKSNNVEKIVQLENQLIELKITHQQEQNHMKRIIQQLQEKLEQKNACETQLSMKRNAVHVQIMPSLKTVTPIPQHQITSYQNEIRQLRQQVSHLTQSLHSQSFHLDTSFSQQNRSSLELQTQIYETDILKRKQSTLEQVLDSKKKEILNKDSIIQMLLSREVQKALFNDPSLRNSNDKKDKVTALVFEMIGYMNGKLSGL